MSAPTPDRDPWLEAALRHAPDADAAPPPAVSAAILRAARGAAASPRPSPQARAHALWRWIASPRAAAAFASLMVATTIGVMWWGAPVDPRVEVPAPTPTAAPPVGATPALDAPPPVATTPGISAAPGPAQDRTAPSPKRRRQEHAAAPAAAGPRHEPSAQPVPSTTAPAPAATPPTGALADAAPAAEAAAAGKAAPAAPVQAEAARAAGVTRPLGQQRDEAAPALKAATPPVASPKAVFDAIRAAPQRWNWRREAEPSRPVDAAMLAWLGDLEAAATRWERGAGAGAPASVTFARGAQPEAWLRFADGTVMLATSTGAAWQATLGADAFAALQSSLERLSR